MHVPMFGKEFTLQVIFSVWTTPSLFCFFMAVECDECGATGGSRHQDGCMICDVAVCHFREGTKYDCHKRHEQKHMHRAWWNDVPEQDEECPEKYITRWGTVKDCR